jgi:lipopolysaccharide transport system ATP-binding protein
MAQIVEVENVSKKFLIRVSHSATLKESLLSKLTGRYERGREFWALRDVNFSLGNGRVLGIIGHNGAGKSTLLRLLSGLGRPTSGRIHCSGHIGSLLELGSGFQGDLTGRQNLMTGGILAGLHRQQVLERQEEIIAFAELEEFIDQPMRTYSSGMFLRLAFATAILFNPDFLVIDEVLAVGDSRFQKKCLDRLQEFRMSGKSIILVSHSMEQVAGLCDEVLVLEEGRVAIQADPETAINYYHDLMRQRTERKRQELIAETNSPIIHGIPSSQNRSGTEEATIDAVNFYKLHGKPVDILNDGEGVIIDLCYCMKEELSDMAVTLGIYTHANVKCFEASIPSMKSLFGSFAHRGSLRCRVEELPLLPGRYYINAGLFPTDWNYIYDYHWQLHPLDVQVRKIVPDDISGIVWMDHSWSLNPEESKLNRSNCSCEIKNSQISRE